ncbi:MAG: DEAD/DEAH box helicase [Mycoplasmatota bacterium]
MNDFKTLGLSKEVLNSIETLGYEKPSKIQEDIIPLIINGYDVIGQAQTGTGKTLAFAASILSKIDIKKNVVQAIILTPTRELAMQVCKEFRGLTQSKSFDIVAVYGGDSIERQIKDLKKGADVVVGTPGRVLDLLKRKRLKLDDISFFVLDEADEMLNMGFLEDIETVLKTTNDEKQILMFSATMPKSIKSLARNYMSEKYEHIVVKSDTKTSDNVLEQYTLVNEKYRLEILCRILDYRNFAKTIIFCHTKKECDELVTELQAKNYSIETMHGDIAQSMRMKTLERFKNGSFKVLIATDVAARGIHIDNIDLVVNYKVPRESETYVHRIGRTGRAGNKGESITLLTHKEMSKLRIIEKSTNCKIVELPIINGIDIMESKYLSIVKEGNEATDKEKAMEYLRDFNKADLLNLAAGLLTNAVKLSVGSDISKEINIKDNSNGRARGIDKNKTRVFINIGSKDGLKKGSLLDLIKKETKMNKDYFNNIEILSTFSFCDVDTKVVKEFIKKFTNKVYAKRKIRIEISNKQK